MTEIEETCEQCGWIVEGTLYEDPATGEDMYAFRCENMTCLNYWEIPAEEFAQ